MTTPPDLLDATGRRIVIEDRTAGVEVLIPIDSQGARRRHPRSASTARSAGPTTPRGQGRADRRRRRWCAAARARPAAGADGRPRVAPRPRQRHGRRRQEARRSLAGRALGRRATGSWSAASPARGSRPRTLVEGRTATIVGIVRRPYPGATDRRWSIAPRSPADVVVGERRRRRRERRRVDGSPLARRAASAARRVRRPGSRPPRMSTSSTSRPRRPGRPGRRPRHGARAGRVPARRRHGRSGGSSCAALPRSTCRSSSPATRSTPRAASSGTAPRIGSSSTTRPDSSGSAIPRSMRPTIGRRSVERRDPARIAGPGTVGRSSPAGCSDPTRRARPESLGIVLISARFAGRYAPPPAASTAPPGGPSGGPPGELDGHAGAGMRDSCVATLSNRA